jgi:hypothetical protein
MPPAPAPGRRIIAVSPPSGRIRKGAFDGGVLLGVLALAATITIVWRWVRRGGVRQRLL